MGKFFAGHRENLEDFVKAAEFFQEELSRHPKTREDFMNKIIKLNNIQLPELEADEPLVLKFRKKQQ